MDRPASSNSLARSTAPSPPPGAARRRRPWPTPRRLRASLDSSHAFAGDRDGCGPDPTRQRVWSRWSGRIGGSRPCHVRERALAGHRRRPRRGRCTTIPENAPPVERQPLVVVRTTPARRRAASPAGVRVSLARAPASRLISESLTIDAMRPHAPDRRIAGPLRGAGAASAQLAEIARNTKRALGAAPDARASRRYLTGRSPKARRTSDLAGVRSPHGRGRRDPLLPDARDARPREPVERGVVRIELGAVAVCLLEVVADDLVTLDELVRRASQSAKRSCSSARVAFGSDSYAASRMSRWRKRNPSSSGNVGAVERMSSLRTSVARCDSTPARTCRRARARPRRRGERPRPRRPRAP